MLLAMPKVLQEVPLLVPVIVSLSIRKTPSLKPMVKVKALIEKLQLQHPLLLALAREVANRLPERVVLLVEISPV